jgi:hypothetical protein
MSFDRIPSELKFRPQWVVWRLVQREGAKKPTKVPFSPKWGGMPASATNPASWGTFDDAIKAHREGDFNGIGFVLSYDDPYTFIDLDDSNGDQAIFDRQQRVFSEFPSYAERSPSGTGLHIICKGRIGPPGRKRAQIEVYSGERFMTMTGDVYRDAPIIDCQDNLSILYNQMGGPAAIYQYGADQEQKEEDGVIIGRAMDAANGQKFRDLFEGNWDRYYSSQSEADFALVDIVAFYTQNRDQIARIFRASALGQRDKAKRNDYVSAMTNRAFDRQLPEVDLESLQSLDRAFAEMLQREERGESEPLLPGFLNINGETVYPPSENENRAGEGPPALTSTTPGKDRFEAGQDVTQDIVSVNQSPIIFPPGLVGEVARFIFDAAPRPVPEYALTAAIGLIAGIVGRAYNISGAGLNQYVLALGATGTGKEAINQGVMKLMSAVRGDGVAGAPSAMDFIGPGDIRSDAALIKWLAKQPCFVSIQGEWGMRLKRMSAPNANANEMGVRQALMDLWGKSGHGNVLNPMAYSDKEKNTASVVAPAFTMIGESTPERFYEALDETLIADGLLPRFLIIEYAGKRAPNNEASANVKPSFALIDMMRTIVAHVSAVMSQNTVINVVLDDQAMQLLKDFDKYADSQMNGDSVRETNLHMWNRAHLKALKLAAIVAVGLNPHHPTIDADCAQWATDIVVRDILNILGRFERGEIGGGAFGAGERRQIDDMIKTIATWMRGDGTEAAKYGIPGNMHMQGVFTYSALNKRLMAMASFRNDRMGATNAIKRAIQNLLDGDDVREIPKSQMATMFGTTARAFAIAKPDTFR